MRAGVEMKGLDELLRDLGRLDDAMKVRVAGKATNFGMTPVLKHARGTVQQRTGFTAESMAKRTKRYKQDNRAVTVVGVKKKAATTVDGKLHKPEKIEHLLHEGFIHAKTGQFVPGTHWMEQATAAKAGEVGRRTVTKLDRELKKEVAKLKR